MPGYLWIIQNYECINEHLLNIFRKLFNVALLEKNQTEFSMQIYKIFKNLMFKTGIHKLRPYLNPEHFLTWHRQVVISVCLFVCLFVCPIITKKPVDWFASNFIGELARPTGIFLAKFWDSKLLSGSTLNGEKSGNRNLRQGAGKRWN